MVFWFQSCAEADGAVAQQEAMYDDSGNSGDGERDHGGSEDPKLSGRNRHSGNGSRTGGFGKGAGADMGVSRMTGRAPGGLGLQYQGHHRCDGPVTAGRMFHEGPGDGKAGRAGRDRDDGEET